MSKARRKFYVVWQGYSPGIYDSWTECQQQTVNYPGAKFKSFDSLEEATAAYDFHAPRAESPSTAHAPAIPE